MKITVLFSILLIVTLFVGCDKNNDTPETTNITLVEIGKNALYGNGQEGVSQSNLVITNNSDWQNLMDQMNSINNVTDNFNETNVDFSKFEIIAVFDIIHNNGGWSIDIMDVVENQNDIIVTYSNISTGNITNIMTQPFHIVKIPKNNKPVTFISQ